MSIYLVIIIGLLIDLFATEIIHHLERRDLYNRIMCHDIRDYGHHVSNEAPKKDESPHRKSINKWKDGGDKA